MLIAAALEEVEDLQKSLLKLARMKNSTKKSTNDTVLDNKGIYKKVC